MKAKRKPRPMETAKCAGCGKPFERFANTSRRRQYCDSEKCQKIKKLPNSVARFSDLPSPTMSLYREIRDYHGGYAE